MTGIEEAVAKAGTLAGLGRLIGASRQNVYLWRKRGFVPLARAAEIERKTGIARNRLVDPAIVDLLKE